MRVLLINPPISERFESTSTILPLGLAYIGTSLLRSGASVEVFDISLNKINKRNVIQKLEEQIHSYDWVGITGLINGYTYINWLCKTIKTIRNNIPVVLGGAICNANIEILLRSTDADICCIGDGEDIVLDLLKVFNNEMNISDVSGIAYKKDNNVYFTTPRTLEDNLMKYDYPSWELFDIEKYSNSKGILNIKPVIHLIGSRGCPYLCKFCSTSNKNIRRRNIESIVNEIEILYKKYNIKHFEFTDELFIINDESAVGFCNSLMERKLNISWWGLGRVNILDKLSIDKLQIFKKSGCHWMGIGVESGSQKILDLMNKGITIEQANSVIKKLRSCGIMPAPSFIIGYPGETRETIRDTIDFCKYNMLPYLRFNYLMPLPGTKVYDEAISLGFIKDEIEYWKKLENPFHEHIIINMTDIPTMELIKLKNKGEEEVLNYYECNNNI